MEKLFTVEKQVAGCNTGFVIILYGLYFLLSITKVCYCRDVQYVVTLANYTACKIGNVMHLSVMLWSLRSC